MPLILTRSNRVETLLERLCERLKDPLEDPFAPEWLVTQNPGMTKWLTLKLSDRFGIWANAQWYFPKRLIERVFWLVLGERAKGLNAWSREAMTLRLLEQLKDLPEDPALGPLKGYLRARPEGNAAMELAQQLAYLFDQYLVYRPDWIGQFQAGRGPVFDQHPEAAWQAPLFRRLAEQTAAPHLVELCAEFLKQLPTKQDLLPRRISVFGVATMPPIFTDLFSALGQVTTLEFYLLAPTDHYWGDIVSPKEALKKELDAESRLEAFEDLYYDQGNPLLAFLGRMGQEFQVLLEERAPAYQPVDLFEEPSGSLLLHDLQKSLLHLIPPPEAPRERAFDSSLEIFGCPSALRELETAKNRILAALDQDPNLHLKDVLVLISDLQSYGPLIPQVFEKEPALPYTLADQPLRAESPLVGALLDLLETPEHRWSRFEVLDWLRIDAVRRQFGFDEEAAEWAEEWLVKAGVRWGRDAKHRAELGQPENQSHTWAFGLKRLMLGYLMDSDGLFEGSAPLAGVEGKEFEQLGPLMDFLEAYETLHARLAGEKPLAQWIALLQWAAGRLFDVDGEDWEQREFRLLLEALMRLEDSQTPLNRRDLALLLSELSAQEEAGRGFLTRGVTLSGMKPMRTIPFRLVVMLGLGEGQFPARTQPTSFDLAARRPRLGDRSKREDDKYLFLEALLAAREQLVLCYPSRSLKDASAKPPSVVLAELIDYLDRSYKIDDQKASQALSFEVPLLAFDRAHFDPQTPQLANRHRQDRQTALVRDAQGPAYHFHQGKLPAAMGEQVELKDLIAFFKDPTQAFLRQGLGLKLYGLNQAQSEREPLELDSLERYGLRQTILEALTQGEAPRHLRQRLDAQGLLPVGHAGDEAFEALLEEARPQADWFNKVFSQGTGRPGQGQLALSWARLTGETLKENRGQLEAGDADGKRMVGLWVEHLFANALWGPQETKALFHSKKGPKGFRFAPVSKPQELLEQLGQVYQQGLQEPLPLFPKEAFLWASQTEDDLKAVKSEWNRTEAYSTRSSEAYGRIWGGADLLFDAAFAGEAKRFRQLSRQVFGPLVGHLSPLED